MADKNVTIGFETTANTAGIDQTVSAVKGLSAEEVAYNERKAMFLTAQEREVAEVQRMVEAAKRLREVKKAENEEHVKSGKEMSRQGQFYNDLSYQVQDFSVQVTSGTSAMRAFSQQAPQMLSAFTQFGVVSGKTAMLVGGIAAAIPFIVMGGQAIANAFGESKDEIDKAVESYGKLSKAHEKLDLQKLTFAGNALKLADERALDLATNQFPKLQKAGFSYAESQIVNATKVAASEQLVATALGLQVDKIKQIVAAEERLKQLRLEKAEEALADIEKRRSDAVNERNKVAKEYNEAISEAESKMALSAQKRAELFKVKNQRAEDEDIVATGRGLNYEVSSGMSGTGGGAAILTAESRDRLDEAKRRLAGTAKGQDDSRIADIEKTVSALETRLTALGEDEKSGKIGEIVALGKKLENADRVMEDTLGGLDRDAQRLVDTFHADESVAKVKNVFDEAAAMASEIQSLASHWKPLEGWGQATAADIQRVTANHLGSIKDVESAIMDLKAMAQMMANGVAKTDDVKELNFQTIAAHNRRLELLELQYKDLKQNARQ